MITGVENQGATWRAMRKYIEARIADLQLYLEVPNEPDHTNLLRGQIKELRMLLQAAEPFDLPTTFSEQSDETTGPLY